MSSFSAIAFDLFNTLVTCDVRLLPQMEIGGRSRASTLPELVGLLGELGHAVDLHHFAHVAARVSAEQEADKLRTGREFPAAHRWTTILAELDIEPESSLVEAVIDCHMATMCAAYGISPEDRTALGRLGECYTLALLSNFDHGPSARRLLDQLELTPLFAHIVISDDLGWRKPEARVFQALLDGLGLAPAACLYVGDSVTFDVAGAHGMGMSAAWITRPDATYPPEAAAPAYRAESVAALAPQLL